MTPSYDEKKLEQLQGRVMGNAAGAIGLLMAYIGDQTGIYRMMEELGPSTHEVLAQKANVDARYLREWLSSNASMGYIEYDAEADTFHLTPEQAAIFSREGEPTCMQGFFQAVVGQYATHDTAIDIFKSGDGRPWDDHHSCCFCGTDRFFRPGYASFLTSEWIPSLKGVESTLISGGKIADIGCGLGASSLLMGEAYPKSQIYGFDFHGTSIESAQNEANERGVKNVSFEQVLAKEFPGKDYDLVCIFDALHDMGDPVGAARHIKNSLKPGGTFMVVEPNAADSLKENMNLFAGIMYGFSTTICVPVSRSQEVGLCLGAQAGERRISNVLREAGFSTINRVSETPTNMVLQAIA
ncbi:MAG: class I SAM-dependent methyltransferase [Pseudohongiellaceae bacterium]